jgi:hypothetical protein
MSMLSIEKRLKAMERKNKQKTEEIAESNKGTDFAKEAEEYDTLWEIVDPNPPKPDGGILPEIPPRNNI